MQDKTTRIVFTGYMYSGKSRIAKMLAKRLGRKYWDTDLEIEQKYHYSVLNIIRDFGEDIFRNMEKETLRQVMQKENAVIATGGGTPCFFDNLSLIKDNSLSIYLELDAKSIYQRHLQARKQRPLLLGKSPQETMKYIEETLQYRRKYYCQADLIIPALDVNINDIIDKLQPYIDIP